MILEISDSIEMTSKIWRNSTGKLHSSHTNLRDSLASVGLIARETRSLEGSSSKNPPNANYELPEGTDEFLKILEKKHLGNFQEFKLLE
jgi:hypothetical protein